MANWCKILTTVLLCGSIAFAQFDDESSEDSYSYGATEETDDVFADNSNEEASSANVGEAKATADEWQGFNYEEMGLTQWEFQQAKQEGISRDKLTNLVEMGIRPSEYLQKPWEKLGVSEQEWIKKLSGGLEDADIDRS